MKTMDDTTTTKGTCPVCSTTRPLRDGKIARHQGAVMRWSGRRWFRTNCAGSGRTPAVSPLPVEEVRHG